MSSVKAEYAPRSAFVNFLSAQGLTVINVEGGMNAWPGHRIAKTD